MSLWQRLWCSTVQKSNHAYVTRTVTVSHSSCLTSQYTLKSQTENAAESPRGRSFGSTCWSNWKRSLNFSTGCKWRSAQYKVMAVVQWFVLWNWQLNGPIPSCVFQAYSKIWMYDFLLTIISSQLKDVHFSFRCYIWVKVEKLVLWTPNSYQSKSTVNKI